MPSWARGGVEASPYELRVNAINPVGLADKIFEAGRD